LVAETQAASGACGRHVADHRAPREPCELQLLEREVDHRTPGLTHETLAAVGGRSPESDLGLAALRMGGDLVQADHAGQLAVATDRPDRLAAVRPPPCDACDELLGVPARVRARRGGPAGYLRVPAGGGERADVGGGG